MLRPLRSRRRPINTRDLTRGLIPCRRVNRNRTTAVAEHSKGKALRNRVPGIHSHLNRRSSSIRTTRAATLAIAAGPRSTCSSPLLPRAEEATTLRRPRVARQAAVAATVGEVIKVGRHHRVAALAAAHPRAVPAAVAAIPAAAAHPADMIDINEFTPYHSTPHSPSGGSIRSLLPPQNCNNS